MKYKFWSIIMTFSITNHFSAQASNIDVTEISNIVAQVAIYADAGEFESLEDLYGPEVQVDYTSLAGGEPSLVSPQALMTSWAQLLPGFDITRHQVSNIDVTICGDKAKVNADIIADHYLNDKYWQVVGRYEYTMQRDSDRWLIVGHSLFLENEKGTRDILALATEIAQKNPVGYIQRQQNKRLVKQFLEALESKDMSTLNSLWAEDAVLDMPYSPEGFPKIVVGVNALRSHYENWPNISGSADFSSQIQFYELVDPQLIWVEFLGDVDVISTQRRYEQDYAALVHIHDGKIKLFREYYDPIRFKQAFGI
jgi:ketosteroid isomerase-like protein